MQAAAALQETAPTTVEAPQQKELLRLLTCGSVDDGKSTLIGRLLHDTKMIYDDQLAAVRRDSLKVGTTGGEIDLALLTDGLKAEREQGITIDVAYRYFSTAKRKFIIADTPGHEQYTRNMATGASTSQLAIILIDARHGVMPQTRRHSYIVSLLGIRHVVVAINKMDLVGYAEGVYEAIRQEYADFVARLGIADVQFIPMSALTGENVVDRSAAMPWYGGPALLDHLETVEVATDRNLTDLRFPVQYVNRPNLDFRGFAGTLASGVLTQGDEVVALPSGRRSRVKSIVTYEGELQEAFAPMAITVTLEDEIDVSRGDMLVRPDSRPHLSAQFEAMVVWMAERPFTPGRGYWIKQATRTVPAQLSEMLYGVNVNTLAQKPPALLAMNEVGRVQLRLSQPIAYDSYKRNPATGAFIIIDRLTNGTVGAGMILEPSAERFEPVVRSSGVSREEREQRFGQRPVTVFLTGAGSAAIATGLERELFDAGRAVTVLDQPVGESPTEGVRQAARIARAMNDAGLICLCAIDGPAEALEEAREIIGVGRFLEVPSSGEGSLAESIEKRLSLLREGGFVPEQGTQPIDR